MFSQYALLPCSGLDFGAQLAHIASEPRAFEVYNHGKFSFDFDIRCGNSHDDAQEEPAKQVVPAGKGKGGAQDKKVEVPSDLRRVGPFAVQPCVGTVAPGGSTRVQVTFHSVGKQMFSEQLHVLVADRSPTDPSEGISFGLTGESVVPGIDFSIHSVFEEHTIQQQLDVLSIVHHEYGIRDKVCAW
jgi:hypothetical protein